ncbi:carbamoyltransferase HypF, partial [bacterium]|nr:carbamoyltransferase HypF [bacterium]
TPLHLLLLKDLTCPVAATSGNLTDEPICFDETEAFERLRGIADLFLVHNRPIARHVDDSVVRVVDDGLQVLRRARGYAPLPLPLPYSQPPLLAVGGHLKNSVVRTLDDRAFTGQHIGDLETLQAERAFHEVIDHLEGLYDAPIETVLHDRHPDYPSTRYANERPEHRFAVQHHLAHAYACIGEHRLQGPVTAIAWDGTGYGRGGTIRGGEVFHVNGSLHRRIAAMRPIPLPGGDRAVREIHRSALGLLFEMEGPAWSEPFNSVKADRFNRVVTDRNLKALMTALERRAHVVPSSGVGRQFDAVAFLLGIADRAAYEGHAAMQLEWAARRAGGSVPTALTGFDLREQAEDKPAVLDWEPMLRDLVRRRKNTNPETLAQAFHTSLADLIVRVAKWNDCSQIVLTGGVFQNRLLTETALSTLREKGFEVYIHRAIPPNDGGIAYGQAVAYSYRAHAQHEHPKRGA